MATDDLNVNASNPSVPPAGGPVPDAFSAVEAMRVAVPATAMDPVIIPPATPVPPVTETLEEVTKEMNDELQEILGSSAAPARESVNVLSSEPASVATPAPVVEVPATPAPMASMPSAPPAEVASPASAAPSSTLPPVPVATDTTDSAHHQVMGQILGAAIETGKQEVPSSPGPLVCRPRQLESWRVFKVMSEFVEGFELIGKYGLAASFFGTARASFDARFYADATALAGKLSKAGYAVITGGSAGVMQAANEGAYEAGGASVGLNIDLDDNQGLNKFLTESMTFHHFFARKVMLAYASDVYIFFPGGFGTLDEFTEIITLVQTKKIRKIPIVLYGAEYWKPLIEFFTTKLDAEYHAINHEDLELYRLCDTVDEAFAYIQTNVTSC